MSAVPSFDLRRFGIARHQVPAGFTVWIFVQRPEQRCISRLGSTFAQRGSHPFAYPQIGAAGVGGVVKQNYKTQQESLALKSMLFKYRLLLFKCMLFES